MNLSSDNLSGSNQREPARASRLLTQSEDRHMNFSHTPFHALVVAGLLGFGGTLFTPAAQAGAFDAFADATLSITAIEPDGDPTGLLIDGYGFPDAAFYTEGAGTATAFADVGYDPSGVLPLLPADNGFATASTSGAAMGYLDYAEGFGDAFLFVDILNGSSATVDLTFALAWSLSASALAVTSNGDAIADAFIDLFVDGLVTDGPAALYEEVVADALLGPTLDEASGSTAFTVSVGPGGAAFIDVVSSAFGAAVPAPSVLALMGLGFGLLGVWRRAMPAALSGPTRPESRR
jgi:hypothetical protein